MTKQQKKSKTNSRKHSKIFSGSKTCDIQLLQKYHMIVKPEKTYVSLTSLPFSNIIDQNTSTIND